MGWNNFEQKARMLNEKKKDSLFKVGKDEKEEQVRAVYMVDGQEGKI